MTPSLFRDARLAQGLSREEVARLAGLPLPVVDAIDQGLFERLPAGLYARAFVRSFATAVGLDPQHAVTAVSEVLPREPDLLAALREIVRAQPAQTVSEMASERLERWGAGRAPWARAVAAATDALALFTLSAALAGLTARVCSMPVAELMHLAGGGVAVMSVLLAVLYFLVSAVRGATPGLWLTGCTLLPCEDRPLTLSEVLSRARHLWLAESSLLVNALAEPLRLGRADGEERVTT